MRMRMKRMRLRMRRMRLRLLLLALGTFLSAAAYRGASGGAHERKTIFI